MRTTTFSFEMKRSKDGTIIEGLSNAATVDRSKEKIATNAWNLDNYKKNPIVLFDHGHDPTFGYMPIGRAIEVRPTENGLYTKIQLSQSKSEKISAVRDLIEEGILKTFSVGFDPIEVEKSADDPDGKIITRAELIEQSIVPIPMNQDSTFALLKKRKHYWKTALASKWYDKYMDRVQLIKKGCWVAAAVHQRLADLLEVGEIRSKDAALRFVAEEAGVSIGDVKSVLDGGLVDVPDSLLSAFANVLRVDLALLKNLNNGDAALMERVMAREAQDQKKEADMNTKAEDPGKDAAKEEMPKEDAPADEEQKSSKAGYVIYAVCVPKNGGTTSVEEAAAFVESHGYDTGTMNETDEEYEFVQPTGEGTDPESLQSLDLGNGVYAKIAQTTGTAEVPKGMDGEDEEKDPAADGKDGKAEVTVEIEEDEEDDKKPADNEEMKEDEPQFTEEEITAAVQAFDEDRKATEEGGEGNPAAWVADEVLWDKAKAASMAAFDEISYPFVVWYYLNQGGGKKSGGVPNFKAVAVDDDNPYLEIGRQTNTLLNVLINEISTMSKKLDGLATASLAKAVEEGSDIGVESSDEDSKDDSETSIDKNLDLLLSYKRDLDKRLKRLNV